MTRQESRTQRLLRIKTDACYDLRFDKDNTPSRDPRAADLLWLVSIIEQLDEENDYLRLALTPRRQVA